MLSDLVQVLINQHMGVEVEIWTNSFELRVQLRLEGLQVKKLKNKHLVRLDLDLVRLIFNHAEFKM